MAIKLGEVLNFYSVWTLCICNSKSRGSSSGKSYIDDFPFFTFKINKMYAPIDLIDDDLNSPSKYTLKTMNTLYEGLSVTSVWQVFCF